MADNKEEEREVFKIQCRILGVLCLLLSLLLFACSIAALVLHQELTGLPVYICGFFIAVYTGLWDLYQSAHFMVLAVQKNNGKPTDRCKNLVRTYMQIFLFHGVMVIAGTVVMGTAVRKWQSVDIDNRVHAIGITSLAGSGVSIAVTLVGVIFTSKHVEPLYGIKLGTFTKETLLVSFKRCRVVYMILGIHQLVWSVIALSVPGFDIGGEPIRIAAVVVGGFITSALAFSSAIICIRVVKLVTDKKKGWQIKTKAMAAVHQPWAFLSIGFCIAGCATYGNNFETYMESYENTYFWTAPDYVVPYMIFLIIGCVLIGLMQLGIIGMEKEIHILCPNTPAPNPATRTSTTTASGTTGNATSTAATGGAAATGTGNAAKKNTPKKRVTNTTSGATGSTSGATGSTSAEPTLEEIKERNRLLQEQIDLQKRLNELQNQQQHPVPSDSVLYNPSSGHIGLQPLLNLPPGYNQSAQYPPGYVTNQNPDALPPAYSELAFQP